MNAHVDRSDANAQRALPLQALQAHLQSQLNGRIRGFRLSAHDRGLVLQGHTHTFHAKQLAQHAVMSATDQPIAANEIEVD